MTRIQRTWKLILKVVDEYKTLSKIRVFLEFWHLNAQLSKIIKTLLTSSCSFIYWNNKIWNFLKNLFFCTMKTWNSVFFVAFSMKFLKNFKFYFFHTWNYNYWSTMFSLFLITVHLKSRIPKKLVFWTVSYPGSTRCICPKTALSRGPCNVE